MHIHHNVCNQFPLQLFVWSNQSISLFIFWRPISSRSRHHVNFGFKYSCFVGYLISRSSTSFAPRTLNLRHFFLVIYYKIYTVRVRYGHFNWMLFIAFFNRSHALLHSRSLAEGLIYILYYYLYSWLVLKYKQIGVIHDGVERRLQVGIDNGVNRGLQVGES